jgi:hypothetical protein
MLGSFLIGAAALFACGTSYAKIGQTVRRTWLGWLFRTAVTGLVVWQIVTIG